MTDWGLGVWKKNGEEFKLLELHSEGSSQWWFGTNVSSGHRSAQPPSRDCGALFPRQLHRLWFHPPAVDFRACFLATLPAGYLNLTKLVQLEPLTACGEEEDERKWEELKVQSNLCFMNTWARPEMVSLLRSVLKEPWQSWERADTSTLVSESVSQVVSFWDMKSAAFVSHFNFWRKLLEIGLKFDLDVNEMCSRFKLINF